jgi:hypothetical protein
MTGKAQMLTTRVPLAPRKLPSGRKLVLTSEGNAIEGPAYVDTTLWTPPRSKPWRGPFAGAA